MPFRLQLKLGKMMVDGGRGGHRWKLESQARGSLHRSGQLYNGKIADAKQINKGQRVACRQLYRKQKQNREGMKVSGG